MRQNMFTRGWIIAAAALVVVVGLVVAVGIAVLVRAGGSDQDKDERPELPVNASVASASASSSAAPVPEESAQKDSRYGSFGRPQTKDEEEAAKQGRSVATPKATSGWDSAQVRQGESFAVDALTKFTAKTDQKTWHAAIDPISTEPFKKAHEAYNPSYSAVGSVGGVISSQASGNPQLLVVKVSTDKGPFTVRVFRETVDSPLQLDHVEPGNPRAAYGS
ncbi:hypothetical protein [Kocuria rhizophila]|uniref:hypothetical protein n=1 Tax=Kocuria rhizophila TaxID=72000 RepID=UPI00190E5103|nr:hypothetical protein [Kocuria rhizophila]MBK4120144.1 hypothetical protein [Kocuria rhizophila]